MTTLALVGCGHIHTPGFIKSILKRPELRVKSVWDHNSARAQKRAGELKAEVVANVASIYADPEITGVVICSETNLHRDLVLPAAAAKKHLFVEKPLGFASADAFEMAAAIEKAGVHFQTGYFQRGDPKHNFLRKQVQSGAFGKITRVRGSNCHSGALGRWFDTDWRWMADPKIAGCGAFGDLGTHSLDILLWIIGDVDSCTALTDVGTQAYGDCDETGEGLLRFKNGAIGTLAAAWDDLADPLKLMISGTQAHAAIISGELYFQCAAVPGADGKTPWKDLPEATPAGFDAYLDAVTGKPAQLVSPREAAYRSAVMEALYTGAKTNSWVKPKAG